MKQPYDLTNHEQRAILALHASEYGITLPDCVGFSRPEWRRNLTLAMDAQPALVTTASSGIPAFLTTLIDPELLRILTAKNAGAEIFGEVKKGSFVDATMMFPVVEHTGEVSSYGDFNENGRSDMNANFPNREACIYQTIIEYGDLEMERAGLAKINTADEKKRAAVTTLNKFQNLTYFFGVSGIQNYGLLNDPGLSAPIAPATKAATGVKWFVGNAPNATGAEVYNDIQALVTTLISQSSGLVNAKSTMVLAMSPKSASALNFTNQFNVNVETQLKTNYPNLRIETAVQYGAITAQNPQGSAAGELVQLIAEEVEGQKTGYMAFNEKLRGGPVIRALSSFKQKMSQGSWGCIVRQPFAIAQMVGV